MTAPQRIVTLLPSATEVVNVLGCADRLVGRSHECDYPASVTALPVCTGPRIDLTGTSREIDDAVKGALTDALSIYEVKADILAGLAPEVIITQDQCEVCAVSLADVEAAVCDLSGVQGARVVSLSPQSLDEMLENIRTVADALGVAAAGGSVVAALRQRIDAVAARGRAREERPTVACVEWTDPIMAAGNWVPEMVKLAGGTDPFGKAGEHAPWISWDDLRTADPEVVVFMPCGFDLARTEQEARAMIQACPGFEDLRASRAGRVYVTDGNAYFNRPGPRLVDSLEMMAEMIDGQDGGTGFHRLTP